MTNTTMNTGAASLSDEQIEALKAAALAATPQDIDGAQRIDRYEDGSQILCPACGGEGYVELNTDFCNYDGEALGVQFYGIGNAHALAEAYFRAAKPATVLALIERLERAEATPAQQADAAPRDDGLIPRPDLERDPLWQWRCIANEAEVVVNHKGKFLMLNEEMCVRLGAALEDAAIAAGGAQEPVATRAEIEHARDRVLAQSKNSLFRSGVKICAGEILSPIEPCDKPPAGWTCSRTKGHEGPCAASLAAPSVEQDEHAERVAAFKGWFSTAGIWNNAITKRAWLAACEWMQASAASTATAAPQGLTDERINELARTHLVAGDDGEIFGLEKFARALLAAAGERDGD
ncbi:hypothetical protein [Paraburkholderia phenoliruptrix]|uniref:hypothetical protein n=1 Tax=Paraburkholderia phenoliruptrix TaxID=252970 RepID=UPI00285BDEA6|nr:hypothetical protein [Paraburkholderia phenoliruptrix]MDR6389162.1 hypothetical protein [Paraburkholderia phenoliruptrix]